MIKTKIDKYSEKFLGYNQKATFEEKNLVLFSFVGSCFFFIAVIVNYFTQDNFFIHIAGLLSCLMMIGTYIYIRFSKIYIISLYLMVLITLFSSFLAWYFFNGIFGSFPLIILMTTIFYALITRGLHRYIVLSLQLVLLVVLSWVEYKNPDIIIHYPSFDAAFFDIFLTIFFGIIFVFVSFRFIIERYLRHETAYRTYKILEQKNLEILKKNEELEKINATKDKFFSIISHDLKNPLSAVSNLAKFLKTSYSQISEVEIRDMIGQIYDSSENLLNLTEQLLTWSKIQSGKLSVNKESFSLNNLVNLNINSLNLLLKNKNITINISIPENLNICADLNMISTILRNLLTNAIKFSHRDGKIDLLIKSNTNEIVVNVIDYGMGMNEDTKKGLFQISKTKSTQGSEGEKGSGLGLILCKEFTEANGGRIWVESQLSVGSIFSFSIPNVQN